MSELHIFSRCIYIIMIKTVKVLKFEYKAEFLRNDKTQYFVYPYSLSFRRNPGIVWLETQRRRLFPIHMFLRRNDFISDKMVIVSGLLEK
ncbi:Uncharacterised protein [Chryseobacterium gleum]|uniref:Uncharacterized protein n=1 Tax=Chryseobacterium gleum TaxID=250 RepID=A0A3S4N328_CHRGE|nr:Uncharacterised protein [Chryseobacterium gleum]